MASRAKGQLKNVLARSTHSGTHSDNVTPFLLL